MATEHIVEAIGFGWIAGCAIFILYLLVLWLQNFPQTAWWRRAVALVVLVIVPLGLFAMESVLYRQGLQENIVLFVEAAMAIFAVWLCRSALKKGIAARANARTPD